ncbi:MAG: hypothetical protein WDM89_01015 [Rhizomicrobium sp.]
MLLAFVTLIAIALVAGFVLSQGFGGKAVHPSNVGGLFNPSPAPAPQAATPLHATPQADDIAPHAPTSMPVPAATTAVKPATVQPLQQKTVSTAPIHVVPAAPKPVVAPNTNAQTSLPALDRLTALANGGNAKAETVVGLKYLNGEGTPVNEAQAAKWLERAAEAGEPVASIVWVISTSAAKASPPIRESDTLVSGRRDAGQSKGDAQSRGCLCRRRRHEEGRCRGRALVFESRLAGPDGLAVQSRGSL